MADHGGLVTIKDVAKGAVKRAAEPLLTKPAASPTKLPEQFFTGAISRGSENSLGQATRAEYINEFIDFWTLDYRGKAKCVAFLGLAIFTWNWFAPFALFCIALAGKYWDTAMWNRNIARFNGHFRTVIYGM